ncbi:MAG: DUF5329 domain-containing protein [Halioglobus sp.]
MNIQFFLKLLIFISLSQPWALAEISRETDEEVQYLLEFVATSGCDLERNGTRHAPEEAADHLRMKYKRGKRYVNTAEQFIDRLASESSWTGRDYTATCDGKEIASGQWLHEALLNHRQGSTPQTESN